MVAYNTLTTKVGNRDSGGELGLAGMGHVGRSMPRSHFTLLSESVCYPSLPSCARTRVGCYAAVRNASSRCGGSERCQRSGRPLPKVQAVVVHDMAVQTSVANTALDTWSIPALAGTRLGRSLPHLFSLARLTMAPGAFLLGQLEYGGV